MNSSVKRRVTPRRKNSRATSVDKPAGPTWVNEACSIVVLGGALFLLLSVLSYVHEISTDAHTHLLGPAGHAFGLFLFNAFGWSSLVVVGYLAYLGQRLWNNEFARIKDEMRRLPSRVVARVIGLVGALVCAAALAATLWGRHGGGALGNVLAHPLVSNLATAGSVIFCGALFIVALALATGNSVQTLLINGSRSIIALARFLIIASPQLVWHGIRMTNRGLAAVLSRVLGARLWSKVSALFVVPEEEPRLKPLPRPKVRKNSITPEDQSEEAPPEEVEEDLPLTNMGEDRDYSHVLVMRRDAAKEREEKKKVTLVQQTPAFTDINDAFPNYEAPDLSLLTKGEPSAGGEDDSELRQKSKQIELKLKDFGIFGRVTQVHPGPVITLFEFEPAPGVKVGRIAALQDDLAMSLKASSIRIIAPIPKRGTVGIEVPNRNRDTVRLRDVLESKSFIDADSILTIGMGKDTYGDPVSVDIAQMPHLLLAGATGTGKSVCINAILLSLLYRSHPSELGLILIDPKILELSTYEDIPHLRVPVVTVPRQARAVLDWAAQEMDRRYRLMQRYGVRNIDGYNRIAKGEEEPDEAIRLKEAALAKAEVIPVVAPIPVGEEEAVMNGAPAPEIEPPIAAELLRPLPKIVIVIDELADLMLTVGREIEELITRLAQKARASGIHLILATQRPSVDVITGLIKANFPARLSFRVTSRVDSRTILDSMGAERLLGRGDMLFMIPGAEALRRVHGAFVSDNEVKRVVEAIKKKAKPCYDERIMHLCQKALEEIKQEGNGEGGVEEYDEVYDRAVELVMQKGQASTSMLQRAFRLGYNRAARIIEVMERDGIIGPMDGAKPREVLVNSREGSV